jgi:hypothetical protein
LGYIPLFTTFGGWGVGVPRWGLGQVTSGSIIHIDVHKFNNKFVSA